MANNKLLQLVYILLGKRLKSGNPILITERDGAVVSAKEGIRISTIRNLKDVATFSNKSAQGYSYC